MATRIGNFFEDTFVAATRKVVFTSPVDVKVAINNINICNTGGLDITITIELHVPATAKYYTLKKDWVIPAGETRTQDGVLVTEGDTGVGTDHHELVFTTDINTLHVFGAYQEVDN